MAGGDRRAETGNRREGNGRFRASSSSQALGFGEAFEAARRQGFRGYFWFPTLDQNAQLDRWTRDTIAEKVNWLYNNVGPVRTVVDGISLDEVETGIWPKAATSNAAFNKASTDRFHDIWQDARFFDTRRVENVYSAQLLMRRHIRMHGELFAQMIRPDGDASPSVRLNFIPAWQIRNSKKEQDNTGGWQDGVLCDKWGAPMMYRVITKPDGSEYVDVPAEDMLHFHDAFWVGQKRGISEMAPLVRKLFTMDDVEKAMANGIQLRTMMAYAIERADGDEGGPTMLALPSESEVEAVETPDGGTLFVQKIISKDGTEVTVAEPPAGRKIKILESNASQEPLTFKKDVLTDLAYCTKYPPNYVFALAAGSLGTEVRWNVRRVETVKRVVRQFQIIPQFLVPVHRFRTWQDIKRGLYDAVQSGVPDDWYLMNPICPADTSVDLGREGKLFDTRVGEGKMSWEEYFGVGGKDRRDVDEENLRVREEREEMLDELNVRRAAKGKAPLEYEDIWPVNGNAAAAAASGGGDASGGAPDLQSGGGQA